MNEPHDADRDSPIEGWRLRRFGRLRPDLAAEMVDRFARSASRRLGEARRALDAGDLEAASLAIHSIKGSAATVGARRLSRLAAESEAELEVGIPEGRASLEELARILPGDVDALRRALGEPSTDPSE